MRPGHNNRLPNHIVGLIAVIVIGIGFLLAFTKQLPWGEAYEVKAVFASAQNVRTSAPVRIAGVEVGKVTKVEPLTAADQDATAAAGDAPLAGADSAKQAAVVTMEIDDAGRPIKTDATFQLRPRLFLEGNLFVDTKSGSPGASEVEDGHVFGPDQTSTSVQLDQVLTTLQSDVRTDLQIFLEEFGSALEDHGGAQGFNELYRSSAAANKSTAQVNEALLGTEPHDLSGLIKNLDKVVRGLDRHEVQLKDLVTNFRTVAGSFAAEDQALETAIAELPRVLEAARPAFRNLNASFPALRAFAREALPGVRSSAPTLDAATPLLHQVRLLSRKKELRGLVADLRPTIPRLAKLTDRTTDFLEQGRALSSCFNNVVIPWSNDSVEAGPGYPHPAVGPVYKETGYGLVGIGGESRSGDANGQFIRVMGGGGPNTVKSEFQTPTTPADQTQFGVLSQPLLGAMPAIGSSAKTPFRPGQPCENQEPPNLNAGSPSGPPGPASASSSRVSAADSPDEQRLRDLLGQLKSSDAKVRKAAAQRLGRFEASGDRGVLRGGSR
jgi:phospholipid/cholesterol/gamma-HCH transport system substrate-binding protein